MKKILMVALSLILMGLMVCNPCAAEAVQELTMYDTASLRDFPDLVDDETVREHKLLERRHEDEQDAMNMLAYKKESGENVAFLYHYDVKYRDKNGNIKDKSKEIVRDGLLSSTSFKTKDNDILSYFSVNDDGNVEVKTVYGEYSIVSVIENRNKGNRITAVRDTEDTLTYRNAVDTGIHLMYEAEYNGVKEYIVLDANSGNKFTFTMDFTGLIPKLADDNSILLLNADGETVLTIPPIYVEDSAAEKHSTYENTVKLTLGKGNRYTLEITVDEDFLNDEGTVYPVYVDPYIVPDKNNIDDAYVREGMPNKNYSTNTTNQVGQTLFNNRSYTYIKFNNLAFVSSYQNILSAYYQTYETSGTNDSVLVDVLPASASWSDTTITWNNQPYYHEEIITKAIAGGESRANVYADEYDIADYGEIGIVRFFISNLVRGWAQGLPNYGIVLRSSYDTGMVKFASSENTNNQYASHVKLVIIYLNDSDYPVEGTLSVPTQNTFFYIKNKRSGQYLTAANISTASDVYQSAYTGDQNQQWTITSAGNDYYYIKLNNTNLVLDVYSGSNTPSGNTNGSNIQVHGLNNGANQRWKLTRNWNGTYQILSAISNNTKGVAVYNASNATGQTCILYSHNVNFVYNDDWTLEPGNLGNTNFFSFTAENYNNYMTDFPMDHAASVAQQMGASSSTNHVNISAYTAYNLLSSSSLWYFAGHGGDSSLCFKNSSGSYSYITTVNANNSISINQLQSNSLRNLYLLATNSCSTGNSDQSTGLDLCGLSYRKGAHFSFGSPCYTTLYQNNLWTTRFMNGLYSGKSIYDAMQYADDGVIDFYEDDYLFEAMRSCTRHYAGDSSIILYHPS